MWMRVFVSLTQKIFIVVVSFIAVACSKEPTTPTTSPSATPLVERSAADPQPMPTEEFRGKFAPGGIQASYRAIFSDGRIQKLEETREPSPQSGAQSGTYEFRGARLMKYRGAALGSPATIELEFDLQGKVLVARAGDASVSPEEISAIRDRAQSLRSHAVAQHETRGHGKI
jgi:hypothetical protein